MDILRFAHSGAFLLALIFLASCAHAVVREDHGDMVPITLRGLPAHEAYFTLDAFQPRPNVTFCHTYSRSPYPDTLDCHVGSRQNYSYVNLEVLEPLLVEQRVFCDERTVIGQQTRVVLLFADQDGFALAHKAWHSEENIIFMTEDPHCHLTTGDRSFYASNRIKWDVDAMMVTIHATPLSARGLQKSGWADRVHRRQGVVPPGFIAQPRPSSGLVPTVPRLSVEGALVKRQKLALAMGSYGCIRGLVTGLVTGAIGCAVGAPIPALEGVILSADKPSPNLLPGIIIGHVDPVAGFAVTCLGVVFFPTHLQWTKSWHHEFNKTHSFPWGIDKTSEVKLPSVDLDCPGCHARGEACMRVDLDFDLRGHHHKGPAICQNSENDRAARGKRNAEGVPKLDDTMWFELQRINAHIQRARQEHHGLAKRTRSTIHDQLFDRDEKNCPHDDPTWPLCNWDAVHQYHQICDPYLDTLLLHPVETALQALECMAKSIVGHTECWDKFHESRDQFEDFEDYSLRLLQRHLDKAELHFEVIKPLDFKLQPRIHANITGGMFEDIDLYPSGLLVPSFGWFANVGGASPVLVNGAVGGPPNPGTQIGSGNGLGRMTFGSPVLRGEFTQSGTINANLTLPGVMAKVGVGKWVMDLTRPPHEMIESTIPIHLEYLGAKVDILDNPFFSMTWSMGPAWDFSLTPNLTPGKPSKPWGHDHIMAPFALGAHAELIKFDTITSAAAANDPDCVEQLGTFDGGAKIEIIYRVGMRLYSGILGARFDTSQVGKLQNASYGVNGLYKSHILLVHCIPSHHKEDPAQLLTKKINKVLDKVQGPIKHEVEKLSDKLNTLGKDAYTLLEGHDIDSLPPIDGSDVKIGWQAFQFAHDLYRDQNRFNYAPDALPESTQECMLNYELAHKELQVNPKIEAMIEWCHHKKNMTFDSIRTIADTHQLASAVESALFCKYATCSTEGGLSTVPSTFVTLTQGAAGSGTALHSTITQGPDAGPTTALNYDPDQALTSLEQCKLFGKCGGTKARETTKP